MIQSLLSHMRLRARETQHRGNPARAGFERGLAHADVELVGVARIRAKGRSIFAFGFIWGKRLAGEAKKTHIVPNSLVVERFELALRCCANSCAGMVCVAGKILGALFCSRARRKSIESIHQSIIDP